MIRTLSIAALLWGTVAEAPCPVQAPSRVRHLSRAWPPPCTTAADLATSPCPWRRAAAPGHTCPTVTLRLPAQVQPDRWFAPDKLRHFFLSFGAAGFAYAGARAAGAGSAADWLAPTAALTAGIAKEITDRRHGWGFSLRDLVWDAAGVGAAMIVLR